MSTTKKFAASEINDALIADLKAKHGKVFKYTTTDKLKTGLFKQPDLTTLDASMAIKTTNPIKSDQIIANNTFLGGDEELITEQKYILGMRLFLGNLIELVAGEFTEL